MSVSPVRWTFDTNKDGHITVREFRQAIQDYNFEGMKNQRRNAKRYVDEVMLEIDSDENKKVTFEEFKEGLMYTTNKAGHETDHFNAFVRFVAQTSVPRNDTETLNYLAEYKFWPPPVWIILISIVQIIVYAVYASDDCTNHALECPPSFSTPLAFRPCKRDQAYRFFTYALIHANPGHIIFNVVIQLVIGLPMEMVHGPVRIALLYCIGALAGSLASSVFDPKTNLVGASGADYTIVGAHVANLIVNWAEMPYHWVRFGILFVLIGGDVALSIRERYFNDTSEANVSYTAHLAGGLLGLTLGTYVLKNIKECKWEVTLKWIGLSIAIIGFIFGIVWNIAYLNDARTGCD